MLKSKRVLAAIVLLALIGGLFVSGVIGGSKASTKKHVVEAIPLTDDFTINLADTDSTNVLAMRIAVKLEPMDDAHYAAFTGGGGGHGSTEAPGPIAVATYPAFNDAVITVASTYHAADLNTPEGKEELRRALITKFTEIAEKDAAEAKGDAGAADPAHVGPPFHVADVLYTKFVVQQL